MATGAPLYQGKNWIRKAELLLAMKALTAKDTSVPALKLQQMHLTFEVHSSDFETPNTMVVRVYNLDPTTSKAIVREYDQVSLSAGYVQGTYGMVFSGAIQKARSGKESMTDNFLEITAGDGDNPRGYNYGFVNTTLNHSVQRATWLQVYEQCAKAFGVSTDKQTMDWLASGLVMPRDRPLYGLARVHMRQLAESLKARWSIQNGVLVVIPNDKVRVGAVTILGPETGLIGIPETTEAGISARCELNPLLTIGSKVQIAKELITATTIRNQFLGYRHPEFMAKLAVDDVYRILQIDYIGDNRGDDWYCDILCAALDKVNDNVIGETSGSA